MDAVETLIVGQGLAGTCLAWALWQRGAEFLLVDAETGASSSRVAAGMINPVTGKSWTTSWRFAEFFPEARAFYRQAEELLGQRFFHELQVVRLCAAPDEAKAAARMADCGLAHRRVAMVPPWRIGSAWEIDGGGRLDAPAFVAASQEFFVSHGCYRQAWVDRDGAGAGVRARRTVFCEGAAGLLGGVAAGLASRCAKGEILTVEIGGLDEARIVVGGGGWLVPLGGNRYKAGAAYVWDELDDRPTAGGRAWVEALLARLLEVDFSVVAHVAGVRPIVRRSEPVIGPLPGGGGAIVFNGLGSKGALYAPGAAMRLANWLVDGAPIEPELTAER